MNSAFTSRISILQLAVLALLAVCLVQPQVRAQEPERVTSAAAAPELEEVTFVFHSISWGMVRGQRVRFTVSNPNEPVMTEQTRQLSFVQVMLLDSRGTVLARRDEIAIPAGEFRSVDFSYEDLSQAGGFAGRVQTRAQIRYRSFYLVDRTRAVGFPTSIELMDEVAGHTTLLISQASMEIGLAGSTSPVNAPSHALSDLPVIVYAGRVLMGLANEQTLRVNALYIGDPANPQRQSVRARVRLNDANGAQLAQSAEATIAVNESRSFDFDRASLIARGETDGGRLQMLVSLEAASTDPFSFTLDPKATGLLAASFELVDNSTGRTCAVWVTVGFFEVLEPNKP